ncbi:MAG: hypothetical protein CMJ24_05735 [Phycisphaerae bacterium]|nr:hypothetical protein [Phycisphaerae bacterium]
MTHIETNDIPSSTFAILHRQGDQWACLQAALGKHEGIRIVSSRMFEVSDERALQSWLRDEGIDMVRVVVPGSSIICRTCSLPESTPEQLDEALQLQAETKLLGTAPFHRTASALLPASVHSTMRTGLILAWPESSDFTGPELETTSLYVPDVVAMASLMGPLHPKAPALWIDREDGTITMVLAQQERVHVRATKEHLPDAESTASSVERLLMESALNSGSTPESSRALASESATMLRTATDPRTLQLPPEVVESMQERIENCQSDPQWLNTWGIAAGAALAMSDELIPLTMFQDSLPEENPDLKEFAIQRLSLVDVAAALVLVAVLLIAIGPMAFHGTRVAMLSVLHPGLSEQVDAFESNKDQEVIYSALMSEAWPMSKLLADIASNTPMGIEVDSIRLGYGEPVRIQGMAMPSNSEESAALATRMKAMLETSGVFSDVTLRWEDSETFGNRSFDISADVQRPQYRPSYALDQDFATWTLSERKSGQDADGNWSDGTTAVAASTSSPDRPTVTPSTASTPPVDTTATRTTTAREPARGATSSTRGSSPSRSPRTTSGGLSSRGDADDRAGDLSSVPTGDEPEPLTEEQIKAFTLDEAKIKLQEVAQARKRSRNDEAKARMKIEFNQLLEHMRNLQRNGGS